MPVVLVDTTPNLTPWVDGSDLAACSPDATTDQRDLAAEAASDILNRLTDFQFGLAERTGYPNVCASDCRCAPSLYLSDWMNYGSSWPYGYGWAAGCSCRATSYVFDVPVSEVTEVIIDGVTLDPAAYSLFDHERLVRIDGETLNCCQDLSTPPGEEGTWEVTFTSGVEVPAPGRIAAIELGCELVKSLLGDASCRLPARVSNTSSQNVSVSFVDPSSIFADGVTGLPTVDLFLASVSPRRQSGRASIGHALQGPRMAYPT